MYPTTTALVAVQFLQKHVSPSITSGDAFAVLAFIVLGLCLVHIWLSERDRKLVKALKTEKDVLKDELEDSDEHVKELEWRPEVAELTAEFCTALRRTDLWQIKDLRHRACTAEAQLEEIQIQSAEDYEPSDEGSNEGWKEIDERPILEWMESTENVEEVSDEENNGWEEIENDQTPALGWVEIHDDETPELAADEAPEPVSSAPASNPSTSSPHYEAQLTD